MRDEFQFHFENQVRDLMDRGLSREQAEIKAHRDFGSVALAKEECREQRASEPFDRLLREIRHALRSLRRTPGYTTAAVVTLALGIGANTAIFSALHGVVLKPLPYPESDRLIVVGLYSPVLKSSWYASYPDFLDWQRGAESFEEAAAFAPAGFDLTNPGSPEHVEGYKVSASFFHTLGVELVAGHSFSSSEDRTGGMPAAVISNRLWRERFHGARSALGKVITLSGESYTIKGVVPEGFHLEDQPADIYVPIGRGNPLYRMDRTVHDLLCLARLKRGVSVPQAQKELNELQQRIDELNPTTERNLRTSVSSLKQELVGDVSGILVLLLGAVAFVLLIACANVANLLLVRSAAREREFAVRRALGASRFQIIGQVMTESVLLSVAGGALGLLIAKPALKAMLLAAPGGLPRSEEIGLNISVLAFTMLLSVAVGLLFGLVPALKHAGSNLQVDVREGGRGSTTRHRGAQKVLAISQIALALVLLSGAGVLLRTIHNLGAVDPGFRPQHVITFQIGLSPLVTNTARTMRVVYKELTERIRRIPGVESADLTALVPLGRGDNSGPFWLGTHQPASMAEIPRALYYPIGPDYPRTMHIPLLRGRSLTDTDTVHSELVVLIDNLLARRYFSNKDPLGQTVTIPHWGAAKAVPARIVGVVGHVEQYGIDGSHGEKPQLYYSLYQLPDDALPLFRNEMTFAVRTSLTSVAVMPEIRRAVYEAGGDQPVYNVHSMPELVSGSMARQRFPMILLTAFAGLSLLLASLGIYAVIAYSTARRVPEIGIRMALGATRPEVVRMLLAEGLRLAAVGVLIGAVAALALTRVLPSFSHLLYGVRAGDPITLLSVSLCLTVAALLACYIPARRAAKLDPLAALRHE